MENNKKNFWKGALAGALAMFMVGAAALGIMNVAGVDLGTSQEKVVNAQEEKRKHGITCHTSSPLEKGRAEGAG